MAATDDVIPSGSSTRVRMSSCAGTPVTRSRTSPASLYASFEYQKRAPGANVGGILRMSVAAPSAGRRVFRAGREAARVRQQMMHRDRTEGFRQLQPRQELVHGDVQIQATGLHLLERDDRGERLGDRADHEPGLRADGGAARDVGEPADDDAEDLVAVGDRDRRARGVRHGEVMLERQADPIEGFREPRHLAYLGEEQPELARGRGRRIAAVHDVLADQRGEVAADRAGRSLDRVGRAHEGSPASIADSPLTLATTTGPPVMKSTSSPKNGLSTCSA